MVRRRLFVDSAMAVPVNSPDLCTASIIKKDVMIPVS
jgi:hypothetical protein